MGYIAIKSTYGLFMIQQEFTLTLRQQRTSKRLTQQALADAASLSLRYIQDLAAGKKQPTLTTILFLAFGLGVSPQQLIAPVWKKWQQEQADSHK